MQVGKALAAPLLEAATFVPEAISRLVTDVPVEQVSES